MTPFCLQAESSHCRKKRDEEASQSNQSQDVASAPKVPSAGLVQSVPLARSVIPIQFGAESGGAAVAPKEDKRAGWGR
jgi:hypothetical protein